MAPPSTPDHFPSSELFDILIRIEVGEGDTARVFQVFKGVLGFYRGYFNTALKHGRWAESQDNTVKLTTEDPKIFELFRCWIHTRHFFIASTMEPSTVISFLTMAKLWIFADAHDVPMLMNEVVNVILRKMRLSKHFFDPDAIDYIYDNTTEHSQLRLLLTENLNLLVWDADTSKCARGVCDRVAVHNWLRSLKRKIQIEEPEEAIAKAQKFNTKEYCDKVAAFEKMGDSERRCWWHVHETGVQCDLN